MKKLLSFFLSLFFFNTIVFASATHWTALAPGLSYAQVYPTPAFPLGAIQAFKINLKYYRLDLVLTQNTHRPLVLVKDVVLEKHALIGINGGFFSPNLKPLGLRIKKGKQISPLKKTSWWGVFYIKNHKAYITSQRNFYKTKNIRFAVQSGPRLIINGRIPSLKPGYSFRSALGITKQGEVIIAITNFIPISTKRFASILRAKTSKGGLNCYNALNLDGGSSSQLYAQIHGFYLNIPSFAPVSDIILVYSR